MTGALWKTLYVITLDSYKELLFQVTIKVTFYQKTNSISSTPSFTCGCFWIHSVLTGLHSSFLSLFVASSGEGEFHGGIQIHSTDQKS